MIANLLLPKEPWYQLLQSLNIRGQIGVIRVVNVLVEVKLSVTFYRLHRLVEYVRLANLSQEPCVGVECVCVCVEWVDCGCGVRVMCVLVHWLYLAIFGKP